jgi:hypothetical protein
LWFTSPKIPLDGKTPLECADTEIGAKEVEDLLGRLEHGVFSQYSYRLSFRSSPDEESEIISQILL